MSVTINTHTIPVAGIRDNSTFDLQSAGNLNSDAVAVTGGAITNITTVGKVQSIGAADAIDLDSAHVKLTGALVGDYAITLDVPAAAGIVMVIQMIATTGVNAVTLALTNVVGGTNPTTATFNAAGETLILVSMSAKWMVISEVGVTLT